MSQLTDCESLCTNFFIVLVHDFEILIYHFISPRKKVSIYVIFPQFQLQKIQIRLKVRPDSHYSPIQGFA